MRHLIQKQVFDLSAGSVKLARQWESHASDMLRDMIVPCMEHCFDEAASAETNLLIDHLEIDLGLLQEDVSAEQVWDKVRSVLLPALHSCSVASEQPLTEPSLSGDQGESKTAVRSLNGLEEKLECFEHFLLHGKLPWWVEAGRTELDSDWIERLNDKQIKSIVQKLAGWKHARERLAQQFSVEFIVKLLHYFQPELVSKTQSSWNWLESISHDSSGLGQVVCKAYWKYWMEQCVTSEASRSDIVKELKRWFQEEEGLKIRIKTILENPGETGNENNRVCTPVRDLLKSALDEMIETDRQSEPVFRKKKDPQAMEDDRKPGLAGDSPLLSAGISEKEQASRLVEQTREAAKEEQQNSRHNANDVDEPMLDEDETALYVEAAGLVLTHPFLTELFRACNLWDKNGWKSPHAQHLAVTLVTWLGHGGIHLPEYRMMMPKLLCGMPWETPLDTTIIPGPRHISAGTELLEAIINHWNVVGNISVEGLREGFIRREGKLHAREDGSWQLNLEKKAQDILLTRLPWGISMIRLPWCTGKNIYVDWI